MTLLLLACAFRPPAQAPALAVAHAPVRVLPIPTLENEVVVTVRAGSAYDPPGREGLAWLTASVIGLAAGVTPSVGPELVTFRAPLDHLDKLASSLVQPPIDAAWLAAVPPPAWSTDCAAIASAALDIGLYGGHPYGRPPWGRSSVRATLSPAEVRGFHARRYTRPATAAAAKDPSVFGAKLDGLPTMLSAPATPTVLPKEAGPALMVVTAPVATSCAAVGSRAGAPSGAADLAALDVLRGWWGDSSMADPRRPEGFRVIVPDLLDNDAALAVGATLGRVRDQGLGAEAAHARAELQPKLYAHFAEDVLAHLLLPDAPDRETEGQALADLTDTDLDARIRRVVPTDGVHVVLVTARAEGLQFGLEEDGRPRVPPTYPAEELFR